MCLGLPGQVIEVGRDPAGLLTGKVSFGGIIKNCCLAFTPDVRPGDHVVVHAGFAISRVDEDEAARILAALEAMAGRGRAGAPPAE
jgi:hydrogenase expression/formation protein HypC